MISDEKETNRTDMKAAFDLVIWISRQPFSLVRTGEGCLKFDICRPKI
jgi:hypothetical protein